MTSVDLNSGFARTNRRRRLLKILASLAILFALTSLYLPPLAPVLPENPVVTAIDDRGEEHIEAALTRALAVYAVARGLNAVVSLAQGTEVALSPAGVGVTLTVGEILDPVNDLLERFSWVMLMAATSLGIQRILLEAGAWLGFDLLLGTGLAVLLLSVWLPVARGLDLRRTAWIFLILAMVARFFIPATAAASELVFNRFLAPDYIQATSTLEAYKEDFQGLTPDGDDGESSSYWEMLNNSGSITNTKRLIAALTDKVSDFANYVVKLIVVFTLDTVVMPLFILWLTARLVRLATGRELWTRLFAPPNPETATS